MSSDLLQVTNRGLYCPAGDFHIDPRAPVEYAVVTHAHADHARRGSTAYLTARPGEALLRQRVGRGARVESLPYGEPVFLGAARVSLHPAGHILGSAQVRIEHDGRVCVVSGDYKLAPDPTCAPFESVPCDTFITETTFAHPDYQWPSFESELDRLHAWWRANQAAGKASVVLAYSVGKAQRLLAGLDDSLGPVVTHGAVHRINRVYRDCGVELPRTTPVHQIAGGRESRRALIITPPISMQSPAPARKRAASAAAEGPGWLRRFRPYSIGFASGWVQRPTLAPEHSPEVETGFVVSDHADWPALCQAIAASQARTVWLMHGEDPTYLRDFLSTKAIDTRIVEFESAN